MIKIKSFGSGSSGNSYLIDDGHSQLLIECGIRFETLAKEMSFNFSRVVGCLISHEHRDHCKGVPLLLKSTSVPVFCTKGTLKGMIGDPALRISANDQYRFKTIRYHETKTIGSWQVAAFELQHDVNEPSGFMITNQIGERLLFITDSYYIKYKFPGVTHLMIEMNYDEDAIESNLEKMPFLKTRIKGSHFSFKNALDFIKLNKSKKLQEVWLLHLSDANSHEQRFKEETQKLTGVPVYMA